MFTLCTLAHNCSKCQSLVATLLWVLCAGSCFDAAPPSTSKGQQQELLKMQSLSRRLSSQQSGQDSQPNSEAAEQPQLLAGRQISRSLSGQRQSGLLHAGHQPQSGQLQAGQQPQSGPSQAGQQLTDQWSQPWMRKLSSMNAIQAADQQVAGVAKAFKSQHAQQQSTHTSDTSSPAVAVDTTADVAGLSQSRPDASTSGRSLPPSSHLSTVQNTQLWIAQQQQRQQQQQKQQQLSVSPSVRGTNAGTPAGNKQGSRPFSAPMIAPASTSFSDASAQEPNKALESQSNSTDAIMEAQRRTLAYLVARDPNRPSWGQLGDQSGNDKRRASSSPRVTQPQITSGARSSRWGPTGVLAGVIPASSAPSGRPAQSFEKLRLPSSSSLPPSSSWDTQSQGSDMQSPAASPKQIQPHALQLQPQAATSSHPEAPGRFTFLRSQSPAHSSAQKLSQGLQGPLPAHPQRLQSSLQSSPRQSQGGLLSLAQQSQTGIARASSLQTKGALDVMGIQRLLQQQASSSQKPLPRPESAGVQRMGDPAMPASDESAAQTM